MHGFFIVAVAMIVTDDEKVLLGKRARTRDFKPGIWEIPAGRLEHGEASEYAILREGKEELNLELKPVGLVDACVFDRKGQNLLLLNYTCDIVGGVPKCSAEHEELRWVTKEEAISLLLYPKQKEVIQRYFELKKRTCFFWVK